MEIICSPLAKKDVKENIQYLQEKFTKREISKFLMEIERVINIIKKKPNTFRTANYKNIRFEVIVPQVTLFYSVKKNNTIVLVRFWNNKKNPVDLQFKENE